MHIAVLLKVRKCFKFQNELICLCSCDNQADEEFRKRLENIIGDDEDAKFSGKDLAMLIRNKYGRSYDVQLIKKVLNYAL
jgi:low affinity Fe/Cu permease